MGRVIAFAAAILPLVLTTGCAATAALERSLVFQAQPSSVGDWTPDPGVEETTFESSDGVRLHGWFAGASKPARPVVLYTHGNGGNLTNCREVLQSFRDMDASVLVFDYRGYGQSEGKPTEAAVLDDARAARKWLATRTGVRESDIVLVGRSLGGGVAVDLAATDGARGLVLENTFTSLPDVAASHLPLLPVRSLMQIKLDSAAKIRRYHGPLLQVHGDADQIVPFAMGQRLFEIANEPKQFVKVPGGDHNDPPTREYTATLERFLNSLPTRE